MFDLDPRLMRTLVESALQGKVPKLAILCVLLLPSPEKQFNNCNFLLLIS